jgi:hypothetical protein
MAMTEDLISTRRIYRRLYGNWPVSMIILHLLMIDEELTKMGSDDMLEARQLIDEKLPQWR